MHAIRSQARKYGLLERQRRHAAAQGFLKDRHRSLRLSSDKTQTQPSRHAPDARSCTCVECTYPSSQDIEPQLSHEVACMLMGSEDISAENKSDILARSGRLQEAGRLREIQRLILQRTSPHTRLGAGRVDPFQCYPIKAEPYVDNLVDHCKSLRLVTIWSLRQSAGREIANPPYWLQISYFAREAQRKLLLNLPSPNNRKEQPPWISSGCS